VLAYPDTSTAEIPMNKSGDIYYYNTTLTEAGYYTYYIWAGDTLNNNAMSASETFALPMNEDVGISGRVHFMDIMAIAVHYNEEW